MAGQTTTKLKEYFQKWKKPTQEQFEELIDSLYEKAASLLPKATGSYNLGSTDKKWKDLHLAGNTHIAGTGNMAKAVVGSLTNSSAEALTPEANVSVDLNNSNIQTLNVTQDTLIAFANPAPGRWAIVLQQDETGHQVSFQADVKVAGTTSSTAGNIDLLDVICDGTTVYVNVVNDFK